MAFVFPTSHAPTSRRRSCCLSPEPLDDRAVDALLAHYRRARALEPADEPDRAAGPADEILARHYGESLAALPLLPAGAGAGSILGSGAGFPGIVLAAARPGAEDDAGRVAGAQVGVPLRRRRTAALPCRCLDARVQVPLPTGLPESIDVITSRALRLDPEVWIALADPLGRWTGAS